MGILTQFGIRQSFSRVGTPGDNAWAESFFATLKKELPQHFAARDEARQAIFAYIESFYNTTRVQARLGYLSPKEYAACLVRSRGKLMLNFLSENLLTFRDTKRAAVDTSVCGNKPV